MKGYILLSIAIISEVFATLCLKISNGFAHLLPSIGVVCVRLWPRLLSFKSISCLYVP